MVSVSAVNVDQDSSATPAPAGPTSVMDGNQRSSATSVLDSVVAENNSEGLSVTLDGLSTALRLVKEASDWNPVLKAALGGIVAVVDLAETVSSNSQDMKDAVDRIQGLLPILETSAKRLEGHQNGFDNGSLMTFA
ncbi:hypothetical protein H0H87_000918, partial [Tephrocybe sp. NHM501043]